MPKTTSDYVLSNIGIREFIADINLTEFTSDNMQELDDVLKVEGLEGNREVKVYKPLNNGGYPKKAGLGKDNGDITMDLVRSDIGSDPKSTYNYLRDWFEKDDAKDPNWRYHFEMKPRGTETGETFYEVTRRVVLPTRFNYGNHDVEIGQEYSVEFAVSGKPEKFTVTELDGVLTFTAVANV